MKNTKYLFNEQKQTPEGMVSVSQIQTFMSCSKKWEYNYIEGLTPRVERPFLSIGKLCHVGMQHAMKGLWAKDHGLLEIKVDPIKYVTEAAVNAIRLEYDGYICNTYLLDEEMPDMEQMLHDAVSVFRQAFEEFEPWKYEVVTLCDKGKLIPALELHFKVPCPPTKGLHGYIDAILKDKETGFAWCTDYKFRKSLSPDEDEAFNIQNAVYSYACAKMGVDITGTMTWQHVNTPAAEPTLLKGGKVSRSKIKTTWAKYEAFCKANLIDPEPYREEMQEKLADIEWFRPTYEYRNPETIKRMWNQCILPAAKAINKLRNASKKKSSIDTYRSLYPWNCKMCQYKDLCQAELRDYDAAAMRQVQFVVRSHVRGAMGDSPLPSVDTDA